MDTIGRVRFSKALLIVAQPTSCSLFGLMSNLIGTTHAIMDHLCVACVMSRRQRLSASHSQNAAYL